MNEDTTCQTFPPANTGALGERCWIMIQKWGGKSMGKPVRNIFYKWRGKFHRRFSTLMWVKKGEYLFFGVNQQLYCTNMYQLFLGEWQWSIVAHGFQDVLRIATNDCENDTYTFVVKKNSNVVYWVLLAILKESKLLRIGWRQIYS